MQNGPVKRTAVATTSAAIGGERQKSLSIPTMFSFSAARFRLSRFTVHSRCECGQAHAMQKQFRSSAEHTETTRVYVPFAPHETSHRQKSSGAPEIFARMHHADMLTHFDAIVAHYIRSNCGRVCGRAQKNTFETYEHCGDVGILIHRDEHERPDGTSHTRRTN